jgi:hypothetical protein
VKKLLLFILMLSPCIWAQTLTSHQIPTKDQTDAIYANKNGAVSACLQSGATANVQIVNALALIPSGGTVDARCYGSSTQTIAATVNLGDGNHQFTFQFDPATGFVPASTSVTTMFALKHYAHTSGQLNVNTSGVSGWAGTVLGVSGNIGSDGLGAIVDGLNCAGGGTGTCVGFTTGNDQYVQWATIKDVQIANMTYGVYLNALETTAGHPTWINGNRFSNVSCWHVTHCAYLTKTSVDGSGNATQVSENAFPNMRAELSDLTTYDAITITGSGSGQNLSNMWSDIAVFDGVSGTPFINLTAQAANNVITGFLCAGSSCAGTVFTDTNSANTITDTYLRGMLSGLYPLLDNTGTRHGYMQGQATGPVFGLDTGNDFRVYQGNGGFKTWAGTGTDHNLYIYSQDAAPAMITFNAPLAILGNIVIPSTVTAYQGNSSGTKLPLAAGTFTSGNLRSTDANGNEVDAGVKPYLTGTTGSIGGSALTAGNCSTGTATVTGATTSMAVVATPVTYPGAAFTWGAYVSASNTVSVAVCTNLAAGGTPTASAYNVRVVQ